MQTLGGGAKGPMPCLLLSSRSNLLVSDANTVPTIVCGPARVARGTVGVSILDACDLFSFGANVMYILYIILLANAYVVVNIHTRQMHVG